MTEQDELYEKAQSLIGRWIYDKERECELLFPYHCYKSYLNDDDVVLECIAIDPNTIDHPTIRDKDVWMSEFKEFYRMVKGNKGIKTWEKIKEQYDGIFKAVKE